MLKLLQFITIIFIIACGSDTQYQEVMVNKTVKVFSQDYHNRAENFFFKWEPPIGPSNQPIQFDLKNDMLIFSPKIVGNYQIHLSITDISHEIIAEEMFYYKAIPETLEVSLAKAKPEKELLPQSDKVKKPTNMLIKHSQPSKKQDVISTAKKENIHYTIQIAAWPTFEQARIDQLKLIEEGFDVYIQRNYKQKKDELWYRVRIGNFSDKIKAQKMQKQIDSITGIKSWLDIIPKETK